MNAKSVLLASLVATLLTPAAWAGVDVDVFAEIRFGRALPPPPPEVIILERIGPPGPPPWAQSHWFRRSYAYYYYAGSDVYYRPGDRMWFYRDGGDWREARQLPPGIRVDFSHNVALTLATNRPYLYHEQVVAYYPANYFAKVKLKRDHDNHPDRELRGTPDARDVRAEHDDKGRGKSKGKGNNK